MIWKRPKIKNKNKKNKWKEKDFFLTNVIVLPEESIGSHFIWKQPKEKKSKKKKYLLLFNSCDCIQKIDQLQ